MEAEQLRTPKRKKRPWEKAFLAALSDTGNVRAACRAAEVGRTTVYDGLSRWPDFAADFRRAEAEAADLLELEARRRAHDGVDEPVIYRGELTGVWVSPSGETVSEGTPGARQIPLTVKKYSDTLLIFLLKGALPKKYRDNMTVDLKRLADEVESMTDEELREVIRKRAGGTGEGAADPGGGEAAGAGGGDE